MDGRAIPRVDIGFFVGIRLWPCYRVLLKHPYPLAFQNADRSSHEDPILQSPRARWRKTEAHYKIRRLLSEAGAISPHKRRRTSAASSKKANSKRSAYPGTLMVGSAAITCKAYGQRDSRNHGV